MRKNEYNVLSEIHSLFRIIPNQLVSGASGRRLGQQTDWGWKTMLRSQFWDCSLNHPAAMQSKLQLIFCVVVCVLSDVTSGQDETETNSQFANTVLPILKSHCLRCHSSIEKAGDLRLDTLSTDLKSDPTVAETWQRILEMIETIEMPPKKSKQIRPGKRKKLVSSISRAVNEAIEWHSKNSGQSVPRRMNRVEYANTMRDLLGLEMDYARDLPSDSASQDGFRNDGQALQMSGEQLATYLDTARRAIAKVIVMGPAPKDYQHTFTVGNVSGWKEKIEFSNRLGRNQEFLAKMTDDYPEYGDFIIRVKFSAELKSNIGFPLMEVSLGYRPDTQIAFRKVGKVEVKDQSEQELEFRGRVEDFPLPVRGQGKFPGLVVRVQNAYDDGSPQPKGEQIKDKGNKWFYPDEPNLPTILIHSVSFQSPPDCTWPPELHRQILFDSKLRETDELAYVSEVLHRFMPRAFRRPVESSEIDRMLEFFRTARATFPTFEEAIRETLSMVLISPKFLYYMEPAGTAEHAMDDWELATRLSSFLWSTMPDEKLRTLAAAGQLRETKKIAVETERLLRDPRSSQFIEQFVEQWLKIDRLNFVAVSNDRFPNFDERIKVDMQRETQQFFKEILDNDLSALNLLHSDFVVINERMARHYQIEGVFGDSFRRVAVDPSLHRGGLFGQASVLLSNSNGRDSHPVRRAVWIRDRILNDPPASPPADVPPLNEADPKFLEMTVRQQLEIHRNTESCAKCHRTLDPWGIALENYDALGSWRDGMDSVAVFSDGRQIVGVDQLREHLVAERSEQFAGSVVSRLLTYALGRKLEITDKPTIDQLRRDFVSDNYRLRGLIKEIVATKAFQTM
jgi:hypothetical protein